MPRQPELKPVGIAGTAVLFGGPGLLLWFATREGIPRLITLGCHPLMAWFLAGGILVFLPLFVGALVAARRDTAERPGTTVTSRLRLHRMNAGDLVWAGAGIAVSLVLMGVIAGAAGTLWPSFRAAPPFLEIHPLGRGTYHLLLAWIPFFFFNIVGEELWWRGYIQPRHEVAFGKGAWVVQAVFWTLFHASFGWSIILLTAPVLVIVPLVVQKRKSTWPGILIHAGINGLGFLAVTLGLLPEHFGS